MPAPSAPRPVEVGSGPADASAPDESSAVSPSRQPRHRLRHREQRPNLLVSASARRAPRVVTPGGRTRIGEQRREVDADLAALLVGEADVESET
jgi:hypothetical protein